MRYTWRDSPMAGRRSAFTRDAIIATSSSGSKTRIPIDRTDAAIAPPGTAVQGIEPSSDVSGSVESSGQGAESWVGKHRTGYKINTDRVRKWKDRLHKRLYGRTKDSQDPQLEAVQSVLMQRFAGSAPMSGANSGVTSVPAAPPMLPRVGDLHGGSMEDATNVGNQTSATPSGMNRELVKIYPTDDGGKPGVRYYFYPQRTNDELVIWRKDMQSHNDAEPVERFRMTPDDDAHYWLDQHPTEFRLFKVSRTRFDAGKTSFDAGRPGLAQGRAYAAAARASTDQIQSMNERNKAFYG